MATGGPGLRQTAPRPLAGSTGLKLARRARLRAALRMPRGQPHRRTSMEPTSRTRRMLIKAGIAGFATPAVAAAQRATTSREGARFNLWVISDCHVGTDKAASAGIQHGLVGFRPPPVYPESLAEALRTSEEGGRFGAPPDRVGYRAQSRRLCGILGR